ncbi:MAG: acyl carrier protein [Bacteroidetes bacterium]|nr:acyl carrier protein [Bacteroidota bacterium]
MEETLIRFIKSEYLDDPDTEITPDTKLISSGLIDSFSLVSLQAFIEKTFGKRIPAPKITADSFNTVRQMVEVINQFQCKDDHHPSLFWNADHCCYRLLADTGKGVEKPVPDVGQPGFSYLPGSLGTSDDPRHDGFHISDCQDDPAREEQEDLAFIWCFRPGTAAGIL